MDLDKSVHLIPANPLLASTNWSETALHTEFGSEKAVAAPEGAARVVQELMGGDMVRRARSIRREDYRYVGEIAL